VDREREVEEEISSGNLLDRRGTTALRGPGGREVRLNYMNDYNIYGDRKEW
jgi:hypothetical protein